MEILYIRDASKYIQKCEGALYLKIKSEIEKLKADPYKNSILKGFLVPTRAQHFFFKRSEYRIAYRIEDNKIIVVILIGPRENFYKKLGR